MTFDREQVQLIFHSWYKSTKRGCYSDNNDSALSRKVIQRKYLLLWRRMAVQWDLHQKVALETHAHRLAKFHLNEWYRFSRTRGKRMKLLSRSIYIWKDAINRNRSEKRLLIEARRAIQHVRARQCVKLWIEAMQSSFILHAYQLHRINRYVRYSPHLCLPVSFTHQSSRLLLIYSWKSVR